MKKLNYSVLLGLLFLVIAANTYGQKIVTAAQVNGTWREVSSKPNAVTTEFWIWSVGSGQLKVEFFANNAVKKFSNTAIDTAAIEGTQSIFKPADAQSDANNPCIMTLNFTGAKLIVKEKGDCGWGAAIGSGGTYKKVSSQKPKFGE